MQRRRQIAVFGSFLANPLSDEYGMAEELGFLLAKNGCDVVCGGHGGIMEALVSGVLRGEGVVKGIVLSASKFPRRSAKIDTRFTEVIQMDSISQRMEYLAGSDGFIFFSGGIGTIAEFSFIWHSLQVAMDSNRPVAFISDNWKHLLTEIRRGQMIKQKYYRMLHLCKCPKDAVSVVTDNYSLKYDDPGGLFYKEAVFFDLEGTVIESAEELFIRACENSGLFFPMEGLITAFRKAAPLRYSPDSYIAYATSVLESIGLDSKGRELAHSLGNDLRAPPELYGDAVRTLQQLRENGFITGVVTRREPRQLEELMRAHGLSGLFDSHVTVGGNPENPTVKGFETALEGLGIAVDQTIYVRDVFQAGDTGRLSHGIDLILLDRHLTHIFEDNGKRIRSLREIKHMVRHFSRRPAS
jgi:hypothetical protein